MTPKPNAELQAAPHIQAHAQQKASPPGSSNHYAFLFVPQPQRMAIQTFQAFCFELRSVSTEFSEPHLAQTKLAWWQTEVARAWQGQPSHPLLRALLPLCAGYGIQERHLQAVLQAGQMDLAQNRYLDFAALQHYCQCASGSAAEVCARILSAKPAAHHAYAQPLGTALHLTQLIQQVGRDALRGRIYLPVNELQQFDVKAHEILQRVPSERFSRLMAFQVQRARRLIGEALEILPAHERRAQKPALILARLARSLLTEIEHADYAVLHQRIALTPLHKFWLAWQVQALGRVGA